MQTEGPFRFVKVGNSQEDKATLRGVRMWNFDEIVRYTVFLHEYLRTYRQNSIRKLHKNDFLQMSQLIRSRNANQCRIFHGKLMKMGQSLEEIFVLLSSNIDQYSQVYQQIKQSAPQFQSSGKSGQAGHFNQAEPQKQIHCDESAVYEVEGVLMEDFKESTNFSLHSFKILTKDDWYDQLEDFLATINDSWLDDV